VFCYPWRWNAGTVHTNLKVVKEAPVRNMPYPYPKELEEMFITADGQRVLLCAIRPEDEPAHCESLSKLTAEDN